MSRIRYTVPTSGTRACLCRDRDTYSIECCNDQDYMAQGIGSITGPTITTTTTQAPETTGFLLQEDEYYILQENNDKIEL